jgi:hypothetical protein
MSTPSRARLTSSGSHAPIVDFRAILRVLGWCVLGLLGYIALCIYFVVLGGL